MSVYSVWLRGILPELISYPANSTATLYIVAVLDENWNSRVGCQEKIVSIHLAETAKGTAYMLSADLFRNVNWELVWELVGLRWTLCECLRPCLNLFSVLIEKIPLIFDYYILNRSVICSTGIMDKVERRVKRMAVSPPQPHPLVTHGYSCNFLVGLLIPKENAVRAWWIVFYVILIWWAIQNMQRMYYGSLKCSIRVFIIEYSLYSYCL